MFSVMVMLFFFKIPSDICPSMTTNTSATFLDIAKGESWVHAGFSAFDLLLYVAVF